MKKNLFILFSIYFFVLQPLIIGVLRGQANFFRLGAINLIAIILIGMVSNSKESEKEEIRDHEKAPAVHKESKVAFHEHFRTAVKEHKKKSELASPFIISFLVAIGIFLLFLGNNSAIEVMLLFALVLGFIIFLSLTLIMKHRITKSFRTLLGTKIYLILLICSLIFTAYDYYQVHQEFNASLQEYISQNFLGQEILPTDGYVFTGEGTVLGTGLGNTTGDETASSDVLVGTSSIQKGDLTFAIVANETGKVLGTSADAKTGREEKGDLSFAIVPSDDTASDTAPSTIGNQKLMDAVIYLLKKYDIPLVTKKDISFTYVTTKNPYYAQRRTAYANKMIGTATNPSKYIVCESYIVMKGLLEKRGVKYTSSTVLANFRAEAVKRNALNGCVKGKIVTDKTL